MSSGWSQLLNTAAQLGTGLIGRAQSGQQVSPLDFVGALVGGLTNASASSAYANLPYNGGLPYGATPPFVPVSTSGYPTGYPAGYPAAYPQQTAYTGAYIPQTTGNITQFGLPQYTGTYGSTLPTAGITTPTSLGQRLSTYQSIDGLAGLSAVELKAALEGGLALYGRSSATSTLSDILLANGLGSELAGAQAYLASAEGQALAGLSPIDQLTYAMIKISSGSYTGSADLARLTASLSASASAVSNITSSYTALGTSALGSTLGTLQGYQSLLGTSTTQVPQFIQQLLAQYYPQLASQLQAGLPTSPIANTSLYSPTASSNALLAQLYPQYASLLAGNAQTTAANPYAALFGASTTQSNPYAALFGATTTQPSLTSLIGGTSSNPYAALFGTTTAQANPFDALFGASTAQSNPYAALFGASTAQSPLNALISGASSNPYAALLGLGTQPTPNYAGLFGQTVQNPLSTVTAPASGLTGIYNALLGQPQVNGFFNAANTAGVVTTTPITLTGDALITYAAQMMLARVQGSLVNGAIPNTAVFRSLFAADATVDDTLFSNVAKWDGSISLDDLKYAIAANLPLKVAGANAATVTPAQLQQWLVSSKVANPETYLSTPGTLTGAGTLPTTTTAILPTAAEKQLATTQSAQYWRSVADHDGTFSTASWEDMHAWIVGSIGENPTIEQVRQMFANVKMIDPATGLITLDEVEFAKITGGTMSQRLATYFIQRNDRTETTKTGVDGQSGTSTVGTLDQTEFTALWYAKPTPCNCDTPPVITPPLITPPAITTLPQPQQPTQRTVYVPVYVPVPGKETTIIKETPAPAPAPTPVNVNVNVTQKQEQKQDQKQEQVAPKGNTPKPTEPEIKPEPLPQPKSGSVFETFGDPKFDMNGDKASDFSWKEDFTVNIATSDGKFVPIKMDSVPNKKNKSDDLPSMLLIPIKGAKDNEIGYLKIEGIANDLKNDDRDGKLRVTNGVFKSLEEAKAQLGGFNQIFEDKDKLFTKQDGTEASGSFNPTSSATTPVDKLDPTALFTVENVTEGKDTNGKSNLIVTLKQGNDTYTLTIHELNDARPNESGKGQTTIELVRTLGAPVLKEAEKKSEDEKVGDKKADGNTASQNQTSSSTDDKNGNEDSNVDVTSTGNAKVTVTKN